MGWRGRWLVDSGGDMHARAVLARRKRGRMAHGGVIGVRGDPKRVRGNGGPCGGVGGRGAAPAPGSQGVSSPVCVRPTRCFAFSPRGRLDGHRSCAADDRR